MPLNVRRFCSLLLAPVFGMCVMASAQTATPTTTGSPAPSIQQPPAQQQVPAVRTPTAAEIMRDRISKAKAFIAVRNYNAANYELESIKRESGDPAVLSVVNVLLMNSYLEQGDYKRAQDFLNQAYSVQKTTAPNAAANYFAVAGQVVRGARARVERYKALGLNPADRTLPLEAINDLENMRATLELVVTQSKEISKDKAKTPDAMAMLEEATTSRSLIARDDYDARKWQNEVADAREDLASSRSVVLSAVTDTPATPLGNVPSQTQTAVTQSVQQAQPDNPVVTNTSFKESAPTQTPNRPTDSLVRSTVSQQPTNQPPTYVPNTDQQRSNRVIPNQPVTQPTTQQQSASPNVNQQVNQSSGQATAQKTFQMPAQQPQPAAADTAKPTSPVDVGSLLSYATKQTQPVYPPAARSMRSSGVVTVKVTIDEEGKVAEIDSASGPSLLQGAAKDAIKNWRFRPFMRDGQPVKATGFVSFNFSL